MALSSTNEKYVMNHLDKATLEVVLQTSINARITAMDSVRDVLNEPTESFKNRYEALLDVRADIENLISKFC